MEYINKYDEFRNLSGVNTADARDHGFSTQLSRHSWQLIEDK